MDTSSFVTVLNILRSEIISRGCTNILLEIGSPGNYVNFSDWNIDKKIPGLRFQSHLLSHGIDVEFRQDDSGTFYAKYHDMPEYLDARKIGYDQLFLSFRAHVIEASERTKRDILSC